MEEEKEHSESLAEEREEKSDTAEKNWRPQED